MTAEQLANQLAQAGLLGDERVADAFRAVPRHLFLPDVPLERVYADLAIYNRTDDRGEFLGGSDRPGETATLLTLAQIEPGHNILHIGTGVGYTAALIGHIVGRKGGGYVTSLEIDKQTADTAQEHLRRAGQSAVQVVHVDGAGGYSPRASYDRIVSSVALWDIPTVWLRQLRPGARVATPVMLDGLQVIAAFEVQDDGSLLSINNISCAFVPIQGLEQLPPHYMYMGGGSALRIYSNEIRSIDAASMHLLMLEDAERCHLGVAPSTDDYWNGFVPYLMLNTPSGFDFVCYAVEGNKLVYGLNGRGFALMTQGSACFVNTNELGSTSCFAGSDAFLAVTEVFAEWTQLERPHINQLRLHLVPKQPNVQPEAPPNGMVFPRRDHHLRVWLASIDEAKTPDGA